MNSDFHWASLLVLSAGAFLTPRIVLAQGTFQNLDFESATVLPVPAGQVGSDVSTAQGLPGWNAYYGGSLVDAIGHNDLSIGGRYISIQGPQWDTSQILQGNYTVELWSDPNFNGQPSLRAAIGQTGLIPSTAQSVRFFATNPGGDVNVTFGEQPIPIVQLGAVRNYIVYGGDISAFAGKTGELRFSSPEPPPNSGAAALLDEIMFSTQPIPEPSGLAMVVLGLSLLGWRCRPARR